MLTLKKKFITLLLILLIFPHLALAHGGVEKSSGNTTVFLNQSPLSPFVNEAVNLDFVIGRPNTTDRLTNLDVELTVTDTNEDESKDKVIFKQVYHTDENGALDFTYTFPRENYFDVELKYIDPANNESGVVGFLVQTRIQTQILPQVIALILGVVVGIVFIKLIEPKKVS
jgi:hypothetical protein